MVLIYLLTMVYKPNLALPPPMQQIPTMQNAQRLMAQSGQPAPAPTLATSNAHGKYFLHLLWQPQTLMENISCNYSSTSNAHGKYFLHLLINLKCPLKIKDSKFSYHEMALWGYHLDHAVGMNAAFRIAWPLQSPIATVTMPYHSLGYDVKQFLTGGVPPTQNSDLVLLLVL